MLALGIGESGFSAPYNPVGSITETFKWTDPTGKGDYVPGDVNLDPTQGDFVSVSGSSNNILNPDLKQPMTNEATASFERELIANLGFRAQYVYKDYHEAIASVNVLRPRSAYNIVLPRRDPGPDGVLATADDGNIVNIYDYDAAFRGSTFVANQRQNSPLPSWYQSIEMTVTKRTSGRWFGMRRATFQ